MGEHQPLKKNVPPYIEKARRVTKKYVAAKLETSVHIILRWYSLLLPEEIGVILKKLKLSIIVYLDFNK